MDIFEPEFQQFIELLNKHKVEYLLIGGYAVNLYGYNRPTGDMDVWVNPTEANTLRLADAIYDYGYEVEELRKFAPYVAEKGLKLDLNEPPVVIDVMAQISGLAFQPCWDSHHSYRIDDVTIHLINRDDLIISKMSTGRPKDADDVQQLQGVQAFINGKKLEFYETPFIPDSSPE